MKYPIPAHTKENQRRASDPRVSAWVSAHAGSGKTHVLTQRVVRLLLTGVPPSRLICLTFTKAAAANMSARVFRTLADWTLADDDTLREKIAATGAEPPKDLDIARKLFAAAVETPGGLKIQTIHAFCERVLHLFPFEANVPAEFRAAEDLERAELLALAQRRVFAKAASDPLLGAALARVAEESSEDGFGAILDAALSEREALEDVESVIARLPAALHLAPGDDEASVRRAMIEDGFHWKTWSGLADVLVQGSDSDRKQAELLRRAAALAPDEECLGHYMTVFLKTTDMNPRARIATKKIDDLEAGLPARLLAEAQRLAGLHDKLLALAALERSTALLRLAAACLEQFDALKRARGVLDFDDMIERTRALFTREGAAVWALYKLDNGVDHILVDEAQDTSEAQWAILEALAAEFTAGAGARPQVRTFFAVGDEKQSIFSFQGASPQSFARMSEVFRQRVEKAGQIFDPVPLNLSFRSARLILEAVDLVFAQAEARRGIQFDLTEPPPTHSALKHEMPGMIEIWEPIAGARAPDPTEWTAPLDLPSETSPPVELARRIAARIKDFLAPGSRDRVHDSQSGALRPVRPCDVMILVRRRDAFFESMVRALKAAGVPVAGADRLDVAAHIAVEDLLAAARAALAPDDDYSLACVLKSPLIGLDDDDLIALAPRRPGSLETALRESSVQSYQEAAARIGLWRERAHGGGPFDFFSAILGADRGRRAFLARLGAEAGDALDEFLALALEHERTQAPSLAAFVHEVATLELTVKRDMEGADDVVRVMTAHAAKGLEGKIVFLPDTCALPPASKRPLFALATAQGPALVWSPRKAEDPAPVAQRRADAQAEVENEYRRLLYVALTRAEERLYICGHIGLTKKSAGCWYDLALAGLADVLETVADDFAPGGAVRRFGAPALGDDRALPSARTEAAAPSWLLSAAADEHEAAPPLRPSSALAGADAPDARETGAAARTSSVQRGVLIHQLMQSLPTLAPDQRAVAALRYVRAQASGLTSTAAEHLAGEALRAQSLVDAAPLFGATSRAEAAIAAQILRSVGAPLDIAGRIDRLAEVGDEVWFADFKTGARPDEAPQAYVAQLALYRAALSELYPGRNVRAFILWTQIPRLEEIADGAMRAALDAI